MNNQKVGNDVYKIIKYRLTRPPNKKRFTS